MFPWLNQCLHNVTLFTLRSSRLQGLLKNPKSTDFCTVVGCMDGFRKDCCFFSMSLPYYMHKRLTMLDVGIREWTENAPN